MTTLVIEDDPAAADVKIDEQNLTIVLTDGRTLTVPLDWYPRLLYGTPSERNHWRLLGDGYAIEWPDLDEHLGMEGLLAGRHSGESRTSLDRWLAARRQAAGNNTAPRGFTLIELLVVITIIVVLISLLAPALDKAVYQAELTRCGAGNLKVMAMGITTYAMNNRRYYPDRDLARRTAKETGKLPINPYTVKRVEPGYDMRPLHSTLFQLNKVFQCPMSPQIDLENYDPLYSDVALDASYGMWWAWQYKSAGVNFRASFKLGDQYEYFDLFAANPQSTYVSFNVMAGDIDMCWNTGPQASHPDREPNRLFPLKAQGDLAFTERLNAGRWSSGGAFDRGPVDTNYVFGDGSVSRYNDVPRVDLPPKGDRRMAIVPINFDDFNDRGKYLDKMHIPLR